MTEEIQDIGKEVVVEKMDKSGKENREDVLSDAQYLAKHYPNFVLAKNFS
jgi:hypothetical protein